MVYFQVLTGKLPEEAEKNENLCDFLADNAPIFEAVTQVCNTSAAGYR
jgi:hypothetical protein